MLKLKVSTIKEFDWRLQTNWAIMFNILCVLGYNGCGEYAFVQSYLSPGCSHNAISTIIS